jgi:hypothetical protein
MESIMMLIIAFAFFAVTSAFAAGATTNPTTTATTQPAVTQPAAADLELHEWAVFILDGSSGQLNPDGVVTATLPAFITDKRYGSASAPPVVVPGNNRGGMMVINGMLVQNNGNTTAAPVHVNADMDLPSPVGIIRLIGSVDSKVDITINIKAGAFVGSWPKAEERTNQLLWRDISVSDQPATPLNVTGPNSWITELRTGKSAYVSLEHVGSEKFLTYDLQMPYPSPVKVKEGKDFSVEVSNISGAALHELTFYQGDHDNWRSVNVGDLEASKHPTATMPTSPTPSAAAPVAGPQPTVITMVAPGGLAPNGAATIVVRSAAVAVAPATQATAIAATPTTASTAVIASTMPTTTPAKSWQLAAAPTTQPADLADAWKPRMIAAGVDAVDANVIAHVIDQYAFDSHRLTAVYRMDDAEFDRILPIEVVPQPAKIRRFGLVIIVNADPSKGTAVDDLITQLGDNDWAKRDAAYHTLAGLGPAATEKLRTASKNTDLEIAWRAERLLALMPNGGK